MSESDLLTGVLEPTNEGYALSKIVGLKLLEYYKKQYGLESVALMPCNLYGTNDSFDLQKSHVLSALVKKFVDAKDNNQNEVEIWGTGIARREFMHVDDLARAVHYFMSCDEVDGFINIGYGKDLSIKELANLISNKVGFEGNIKWDHSKPDGMLKKCLDVNRMNDYDFYPEISLDEGVTRTINEYKLIKNYYDSINEKCVFK
jgi:GDP-L-fucose synthase